MKSIATPIFLASASPRRRELLRRVGLPFTAIPSQVPEEIAAGDPLDLVKGLARLKACEIAGRIDRGLVIGADTIVVLADDILGKPGSEQEARDMLSRLSGATHRVLTGVAIVEVPGGNTLVEHEETLVTFRDLTPGEIASYVASGEPMDKAGGYGAQGLGAVLIKRIEGCYFNVVGLPLSRLSEMLCQFGVHILS